MTDPTNLSSSHSPSGEPQFDFLEYLLQRNANAGGLTEIRIIGPHREVWTGRFHEGDAGLVGALLRPAPNEAKSAWPRSGEAQVYAVLNPVPDDGKGARGRFVRTKNAASDKDIVSPSLVLVDCDPVRAAGESANEEEKQAAYALARKISRHFDEQGITHMTGDSGNGYHLLLPVEPHGGDYAETTRRLLKGLAARFDTSGAKVDQCTYNPSRCAKLYGTWAVKGKHSDLRPHRLSSIVLPDFPCDANAWADIEALCDELGGSVHREHLPAVPGVRAPMSADPTWAQWRRDTLARLRLEDVYGEVLVGGASGLGWLRARDPWSPSGDRTPSAGVADGMGEAERGAFHSFRSGETLSVFDYLVRTGRAADFAAACRLVSDFTSVPGPRSSRANTANASPAPAAHSGKPVGSRPTVRFDSRAEDIDGVHRRIADCLAASGTVYRRGNHLVAVSGDCVPVVLTHDNIAGRFAAHAEFAGVGRGKDGDTIRYTPLPQNIGSSWIENPKQRERFPELVSWLTAPQFSKTWEWNGTPGYHASSGTYFSGPPVPVRSPDTTIIDELLAEFPWRSEADRVNYIGSMLTVVTLLHWAHGHPFVFIDGNQPGLGKSKLGRMLGVLADGEETRPVTFTPREDEFEKRLATMLAIGRHVMLIDNVRVDGGQISSASLEVATVSARPSFRRLGTNDVIERSINDVIFCLTVNSGQLNRDLGRRMLPVQLHFDGDPRQRTFRRPDPVVELQSRRVEVLGVLAGMVQAWLDAGRPLRDPAPRHSTNDAWAATIDGVLLLAGYDGFLANFDTVRAATDARFGQVLTVAEELWQDGPAHAAEWVARIDAAGIPGLWTADATPRARETRLAGLLRSYTDHLFVVCAGTFRLTITENHGKAVYAFERIPPAHT
jgi:hypothetical protein